MTYDKINLHFIEEIGSSLASVKRLKDNNLIYYILCGHTSLNPVLNPV